MKKKKSFLTLNTETLRSLTELDAATVAGAGSLSAQVELGSKSRPASDKVRTR